MFDGRSFPFQLFNYLQFIEGKERFPRIKLLACLVVFLFIVYYKKSNLYISDIYFYVNYSLLK